MSEIVVRPGVWTELPEMLSVDPCYHCGKQSYPWYETPEGQLLAMLDDCDMTIGSNGTTVTPHFSSCATKRRCNCCGR